MPLGIARINSLSRVISAGGGSRTAISVTGSGDAQVDTAQGKFGGASALFDGSGDIISTDTNLSYFETTSDYTIEGWYYYTNVSVASDVFLIGTINVGTRVSVTTTTSGTIGVDNRGAAPDITAAGSLSTGTWYHIALVQASGVQTLYLNGTSIGSCTPVLATGGDGYIQFGGYKLSGVVYRTHNGNIDEMRVSNIARYTANFTPPATAFVNDDNTLLLIHADGADGSTTFTDDNEE